MICNGVFSKYYKILRLNMSYGVLVVVFNIHLVSMLILKLLNRRMIGLLALILTVIIHNQDILTLLLMLVLKLFLENHYKILLLGLKVLVVLLLLVDLEWLLRYTIEIQDYLVQMSIKIKKFKKLLLI